MRCTTLRFTALTYDAMTAVSISNKAKEEEEVEARGWKKPHRF